METAFYPIREMFDDVELSAREGEGCTVKMLELAEEVPLEKNLCYRAWKAMQEVHPWGLPGVHIQVRKRIPTGSGLGGGSSNAASVLRGLRDLYLPEMNDGMLAGLGEQLGADVPFFIYNRPMFARGIGTEFSELDLDLSRYRIVVHTLDLHSSTPDAFKGIDLDQLPQREPLANLLQLPIEQWKGRVCNDLESSVFPRHPEVAALREKLYAEGAIYAAMTGSGSACFGIFPR
jgi:4-diphosphocytidyl-2-C-methyl-D-erythritol kinase